MGQLIELRTKGTGKRDYLDGQSIYNGSILLVWAIGQWLRVRYEVVNPETYEVLLYQGRDVMPLDRASMRFKWPEVK